MKIEKLTENKIRVIINSNELSIPNNNNNNIIINGIESQELFLDILKRAEKEVNFYTDGCKLLIETFSSLDDFLVFTITKYISNDNTKNITKVKPVAKRKSFIKPNKHAICLFENFDVFCEFCNAIKSMYNVYFEKLVNNSSLYLWEDSYYLILRNTDVKYEKSDMLYSMLSEFANGISFSNNFESKLIEHGKTIIKKNAISVGIKFFTK